MRTLPDKINLLAYPWMRAQVLQYALNPLIRDGNLRLLHRYSPTHVKLASNCPETHTDVEDAQFAALRSILTLGYRDDLIKREAYHDRMWMGGTPILVDIDGNGDLILKDGGHRILFLLVSGASEIWATVGTRSPAWVAFVESVDAIASGYLYAHLPHPDFDGWPTGRRETRVPMLFREIRDMGITTAVDIGACTGAFACDLSAVVPSVVGIERDPRLLAVARWRNRHTGNAVKFEQGELLNWHGEADLVSCLSVLHHVVEASGADAVRAWLTDLRCRYLLIEYPTPGEPWLEGRPAAAAFGDNLTCDLTRAGYTLEADLGRDNGFPATARNVVLWRKSGA